MAIMMGKLRAALVAGGTPEGMAEDAATEIASYETRISGVEARLSVLTWMAGTNIALTAAVLLKLFH